MIDYRVIRDRLDADVKSLGAITALSNEDPPSLAAQIEGFAAELEHLDPAERLLIGAYVGAELIGFCRFIRSDKPETWWCRGLEVVGQCQRQGVGAALLVAGLNHLRAAGAATVRSSTGIKNIASQATHVKAGFRLTATAGEDFDGRWRDNYCYYQWDALSAQ